MRAKIIAVTRPLDGSSAEKFIAYCARVSNPKNQGKSAQKLIRYLKDHKHWSPFEMVHVVMDIETTRDIARQLLRHRSFSFQEFSQRYSSEVEFAEPREARLQDAKNRQNSLETDDTGLKYSWSNDQATLIDFVEASYKAAIEKGIAKEVARAILPEGLTMSHLYMSGTLRSWMHYFDVRCGPETQKEHRELAMLCRSEFAKEFPEIEFSWPADND